MSDGPRYVTAGALSKLLAKVDPEMPVCYWDGDYMWLPVVGFEIETAYGLEHVGVGDDVPCVRLKGIA